MTISKEAAIEIISTLECKLRESRVNFIIIGLDTFKKLTNSPNLTRSECRRIFNIGLEYSLLVVVGYNVVSVIRDVKLFDNSEQVVQKDDPQTELAVNVPEAFKFLLSCTGRLETVRFGSRKLAENYFTLVVDHMVWVYLSDDGLSIGSLYDKAILKVGNSPFQVPWTALHHDWRAYIVNLLRRSLEEESTEHPEFLALDDEDEDFSA